MQHGDIQTNVSLRGEPQALFVYWRGSLREILPTTAQVSITRPLRKSRFDYWDPSISLERMNRAEMKRAELSISEHSLDMEPEEIEAARHLTDVLWKWLSKRQHGVPALDQPVTRARVTLEAEGDESLLDVINSFDPEIVGSV
jgi:hypothetical protein